MISTLHQTKLTSRANPTCDSSRLAWHVTQSDRYSVLCWVDTNLPMIFCQSMDAICSLFSANFSPEKLEKAVPLSVWARGFAKSCMSNPSECMFYQWLAESIHQVWMVSDTGYLARTETGDIKIPRQLSPVVHLHSVSDTFQCKLSYTDISQI